ncbi:hypothetical protein MQE36_09050 [Zhouia spongiae]|uniref:Uncharacterized protein n=1 Tax=Zhouia spongiae TaxID=2202721 RepID=A0ABY3YH03_9FLAO|nr:hypothetical protein [Zhouia spongiae]UNY97244.1 hypothetical protein MQE36_09050 [Zhouia spongiae]
MKTKLLYTLGFANLFIFCFYLYSFTTQKDSTDFSNKILKVKGVVVVDSLGIERVIIGSHLPPAQTAKGYRKDTRGNSVSGVMLYDHEGQERGGYVTDDDYGNAFLTLDSKIGQHLLMLCEPQGSAYMAMWDGKNAIQLKTAKDDGYIKLTKGNQQIKLYEDEK